MANGGPSKLKTFWRRIFGQRRKKIKGDGYGGSSRPFTLKKY